MKLEAKRNILYLIVKVITIIQPTFSKKPKKLIPKPLKHQCGKMGAAPTPNTRWHSDAPPTRRFALFFFFFFWFASIWVDRVDSSWFGSNFGRNQTKPTYSALITAKISRNLPKLAKIDWYQTKSYEIGRNIRKKK